MKFKVGEIAIWHPIGVETDVEAGAEVEIYAVGPFRPDEIATRGGWYCDEPCDYIVTVIDSTVQDGQMFVDEKYLRKRPQPGIPESILRIFEVEAKQERPA